MGISGYRVLVWRMMVYAARIFTSGELHGRTHRSWTEWAGQYAQVTVTLQPTATEAVARPGSVANRPAAVCGDNALPARRDSTHVWAYSPEQCSITRYYCPYRQGQLLPNGKIIGAIKSGLWGLNNVGFTLRQALLSHRSGEFVSMAGAEREGDNACFG